MVVLRRVLEGPLAGILERILARQPSAEEEGGDYFLLARQDQRFEVNYQEFARLHSGFSPTSFQLILQSTLAKSSQLTLFHQSRLLSQLPSKYYDCLRAIFRKVRNASFYGHRLADTLSDLQWGAIADALYNSKVPTRPPSLCHSNHPVRMFFRRSLKQGSASSNPTLALAHCRRSLEDSSMLLVPRCLL